MNRTRNPRKAQGGQAMVEFAILMIVFIPMLVYSFYFMDLGHHMLDLQELVVSTAWDYTGRTNQVNDEGSADKSLKAVYHFTRYEYIDHTSAYDDYTMPPNGGDEKKYHFEMGAKAAYVNSNKKGGDGLGELSYGQWKSDYATEDARQITCGNDITGDLDWIPSLGGTDPATDFAKDTKYNKGGLVTCWAKLFVYNYVIPQKFIQEHAHEDMTQQEKESLSTSVEGLGAAAKPIVLRDHASISIGTWAINNGAKGNLARQVLQGNAGDITYCPEASNPFYERVAWMYTGGGLPNHNAFALTYDNVMARGLAFMGKGASKKLELIRAIPVIVGTTDGSPEGFECPSLADFETMAGSPANVLGVNLVARHDKDNDTKYKGDSWDFINGSPGYESWPSQKGNGDFHTAFSNRGAFYLGNQNAETE